MPYSFGLGTRVGIILDDEWFLYGTIGGKVTRFEASALTGDIVDGKDSTFVTGIYYGAGAEYAIWCGHRLGLEVVWTRYPDKNFDIQVPGDTVRHCFEPQTTAVRLSYIIPF